MSSILKKYIAEFQSGRDLAGDDAEPVLDALITEIDESLMAEVFIAWDRKRIEENEIFSIANILRARCTKVNSRHETVVDIVGTGGSKAKTFNVSTAAAFVVAGAELRLRNTGTRRPPVTPAARTCLSILGVEPQRLMPLRLKDA
jgi:anthranilate phosphoribosyltransferase